MLCNGVKEETSTGENCWACRWAHMMHCSLTQKCLFWFGSLHSDNYSLPFLFEWVFVCDLQFASPVLYWIKLSQLVKTWVGRHCYCWRTSSCPYPCIERGDPFSQRWNELENILTSFKMVFPDFQSSSLRWTNDHLPTLLLAVPKSKEK